MIAIIIVVVVIIYEVSLDIFTNAVDTYIFWYLSCVHNDWCTVCAGIFDSIQHHNIVRIQPIANMGGHVFFRIAKGVCVVLTMTHNTKLYLLIIFILYLTPFDRIQSIYNIAKSPVDVCDITT